MAKPIEFDESDTTYVADECGDLPAYRDAENDSITSCWELSSEELMEVLETKRVWLVVHGNSQPPVEVTGEHPFYFGGVKNKPPSL